MSNCKLKAKIYDKVPHGWREDKRALTAPMGYVWITNGESRFKGNRKSGLISIENFKKER